MSFLPESFTAAYVANPDTDAASTWAPIKDAPADSHACDGCRGDGVYYGAGAVVNGVFKGFTGRCFRCGGKGYQTDKDVKRNRYYDAHCRRLHA